MAWLIRCLHILLKPSSREKGFVSLPVIIILTIGGLLCGFYGSDALQSMSAFSQAQYRTITGDSTNKDMHAFHDVYDDLSKLASPSAPITSPLDPKSMGEYLGYSLIIDFVKKNVNTPTPKPGGRGRPGQPVACSLSVEPGLAAPGDYITVTVTVPTIFKSRIAGITGSAGVAGFSITPSGGSRLVLIPREICEQTLPISCKAYGPDGTVFSSSTSVKVDFSGLPDSDNDGIVDRCDPDTGCDPPACCSEYPINCGDICCPADFPVCCGDGTCCPAGSICCGDTCCPAGTFCCGGRGCCLNGSVCCGDGTCCPDGQACCDDGCCSPGWFCCPDQLGCCPVGTTCSEDGHCE